MHQATQSSNPPRPVPANHFQWKFAAKSAARWRTAISQRGTQAQETTAPLNQAFKRRPFLHNDYQIVSSLITSSSNTKSIKKARDEIADIVDGCKSLERGVGESERSLSNHISKIRKNMEFTQTVSRLVSKDVYF